jgi:hypothetical protein
MPLDKLIDSTLEKYNLPTWVKPYVIDYAKSNPLNAIGFATSLIDVKRKKGEVTKTHVKLPNGTTFETESVLKILNLFYYGEEGMGHIEEKWSTSTADRNAEYENNYSVMSGIDLKRARALKNLAEGLGHKVGEQPKSIVKVFDRIEKIENWYDRIIATGIALRFAYSTTFGIVFYKVFYPVSPEFMRSFGKAFGDKKETTRWDTEEARRLIQNNLVDKEHVLQLTRDILTDVFLSIESNISIAKEIKLEKEVRLLSDISIAFPFQVLVEMGIDVDVEKEVKAIMGSSKF